METNQFALYQGKIVYVPDVPEEPTKRESFESYAGTVYMGGDFGYEKAMKKYREALQSAIASGKEVENQDEVLDQLWRHDERINSPIPFLYWKENMLPRTKDMLYPLQCRVEIVQICETNGDACPIYDSILHKKVARVTFEQPEKKNTRKSPEYHHARKQHFIDDYAKRREYMNMEDSLSNLYDKYCVPCELPALKQPEAAGQEQEDNEYLERVLFLSLAQRDCTTDEGLDKAVEETFLNLKDKFTITRKP